MMGAVALAIASKSGHASTRAVTNAHAMPVSSLLLNREIFLSASNAMSSKSSGEG